MKLIDHSGAKFGKLLVVKMHRQPHGRPRWECKCECGKTVMVLANSLMNGQKSCGCVRAVTIAKVFTTHGHTTGGKASTEYAIWMGIKRRVLYPNCASFKRYGGRGIGIHPDWLKFENFLRDMGPRPKGMSIDRIDNDGDYTPKNCRWATRHVQMHNRYNTIRTECRGQLRNLSEISDLTGISRNLLNNRYWRGKRGEELIKKP